jgi:hypothetical protein
MPTAAMTATTRDTTETALKNMCAFQHTSVARRTLPTLEP